MIRRPPLTPIAELRERLRGAGLRATKARIEVLRALAERSGPVTHADLVRALAHAGLDRATIFRNLTDLTRVGLLSRRDMGDHTWRFELQARAAEHQAVHPHLFCTQCSSVRCLPDVQVQILTGPQAPAWLKNGPWDVHLRGICGAC